MAQDFKYNINTGDVFFIKTETTGSVVEFRYQDSGGNNSTFYWNSINPTDIVQWECDTRDEQQDRISKDLQKVWKFNYWVVQNGGRSTFNLNDCRSNQELSIDGIVFTSNTTSSVSINFGSGISFFNAPKLYRGYLNRSIDSTY